MSYLDTRRIISRNLQDGIIEVIMALLHALSSTVSNTLFKN